MPRPSKTFVGLLASFLREPRLQQPDRHPLRATRWKFAYEQLEDWTLLTATLYIDYGDRFPGGVLNTTVGELNSHVFNGQNINGPRLTDATGSNYANGTAVQMTSFNTLYPGANGASMRAIMDAIVQRVYAPYDVTVVDLTADFQNVNGHMVRAAANLDDVAATLSANSGDPKHFNSYVFVSQDLIGASNDNPATFATNGYGGLANGLNIGGNKNNSNTALVLLIGAGDGALFHGDQIAHESGHLFGFAHVYRQDTGNPPPASLGTYGPQLDQLESSDLMSYLAYNGFDVFSRVPVMKGDGNTNSNTLVNTPTPYDHLVADANVGASNMEYVTGTGANDIITITKTGATTANVTVQPFSDTTYTTPINFPGSASASYSYSIDLTKPLVIEGIGGNDRFVLDGDLGTTISVRGAAGTDSLVVLGKGAANGTYTPGTNDVNAIDGNPDRRGTVVIGATTINFQEFDPNSTVTVSNLVNFTLTTPAAPVGGSGGNILTIASGGPGQSRIGGSTSGVPIVPLLFSDVTSFTVDTATNNAASPDDTITLASPLVATGLKNFTINTGAGDDTFIADANFALPVPGGQFTYNAGPETTASGDNLIVNATGTSVGAFNPDGGTDNNGVFTEDGTNLVTTDLERAEVQGFTSFVLTTPNDADVMTITPDLTGNGLLGENKIAGSSGGVAFSTLSFYKTTNFTIDSLSKKVGGLRGDRYTVNNPGGPALEAEGLQNFTINSGPGNDLLTVNAGDFRLPVAGGKFTFNAGSGAFNDGTLESNVRGLISLDRVVVNANVDFTLVDKPHTFADNSPIPDDTSSGQDLSISNPGTGSGLGTLTMFGVESAVLTGGLATKMMDASAFNGAVVLHSGGGTTTLIGGSGDNVLYGGAGTDTLIAGPGRPDGHNNVLIGGGGVNVLIGGSGNETFIANPGAGTTTMLGGSGRNTFRIINPAGTVTAPIGGFEVIGGAGASKNELTITGGGSLNFTEVYMVGTFPAAPGVTISTLSSLGLDVPSALLTTQFNGEITTSDSFSGPTAPVTQSIRVAGLGAIIDDVTVKSLKALATPGAQPISAGGSNLSGGLLKLTTSEGAFTPVTFTNKLNVGVYGQGGAVVLSFPTIMMASVAPAAASAPPSEPAAQTVAAPPVVGPVAPPVAAPVAPFVVPTVAVTNPFLNATALKNPFLRATAFANPFARPTAAFSRLTLGKAVFRPTITRVPARFPSAVNPTARFAPAANRFSIPAAARFAAPRALSFRRTV